MIKTIGLFSPGEMGSQVAGVLKENKLDVVTCTAGRSEKTRGLAQKIGIRDLSTVREVVHAVDLILSVLVPDAAMPMAQTVAAAMDDTRKKLIYVDANAISPMTARSISDVIERAGGLFVDAGIIGGAARLRQGTTFYASGPHAAKFAQLKECGLRIEVIGPEVGQASGFKMLYAGMTKGLSALAIELLAAADAYGCLDALWAKYRETIPGVAATVEGILPGVPFRAARRSQEMIELAEMMSVAGLSAYMPSAAAHVLRDVGDRKFATLYPPETEKSWNARDVTKVIRNRKPA